VAVHEIIHFFWFNLWHELFGDSPEFYEQPHLPWIVSELAIDAIFSDKRLNYLITNPEAAARPASGYPMFYEITTPDGPITDIARKIYKANNIRGFMREIYELCEQNYDAIGKYFNY